MLHHAGETILKVYQSDVHPAWDFKSQTAVTVSSRILFIAETMGVLTTASAMVALLALVRAAPVCEELVKPLHLKDLTPVSVTHTNKPCIIFYMHYNSEHYRTYQ